MNQSEPSSRHLLVRRRHRKPRRIDHRGTVFGTTAAIAGSVLVALMATGGSLALWNTSATVQIPSIAAEAASVTTQGLSSLDTTYKLITAESKTGAFQITNPGSASSTYSTAVTLSADSSTTVAKAITVSVWKTTSLANCAVKPPSAVSGTWAAMPAMTGTIAAGASVFYCVQTSMTENAIVLYSGKVTATLTVAMKSGSATSTASSSVTQSVAGIFQAASKAPAASAASTPASSTPAASVPDPSLWYSVIDPAGDCLQLAADGATVSVAACDSPPTAAQQWQFRSTGDGHFTVVSRDSRGLLLSAAPDGSLQALPADGSAVQQWQPVALVAGGYQLVSRTDASCLTTTDAAPHQSACVTPAAQHFALTAVA